MKEKVMEHPSGLVLPIELARKIQREGVSAIPDEILEQCDLWQALHSLGWQVRCIMPTPLTPVGGRWARSSVLRAAIASC